MRMHFWFALASAFPTNHAEVFSSEATSLLQAKIRAAKESEDCASGKCNPPTEAPFIATTTTTTLGGRQACKVFGDPHVIPFDMPRRGQPGYDQVDPWIEQNVKFGNLMYDNGQFWLVKGTDVSIQGLFWADDFFQSSLSSLAISGKMFGDSEKTLIIEPYSSFGHAGKIYYTDGQEISLDSANQKYSDEYIEIKELWTTIMPKKQQLKIKFKQGHFTSSLDLDVLRYDRHVDTEIFMKKRVDVLGFCGNMDGSLGDEAANMERADNRVEDVDLLFPYVSFDVKGCGTTGDIPAGFSKHQSMRTRKDGHTAQLCGNVCEGKGFDAFILAGSQDLLQDCYCGNKDGVSSMAVEGACSRIDCFEGEIAVGATCAYTKKCKDKKPHECSAADRAEGNNQCTAHGLSGIALKSCVFDYCFGDEASRNELVMDDTAFWKVVTQEDPGEVGFECKDVKDSGPCDCSNEADKQLLCSATCGTC